MASKAVLSVDSLYTGNAIITDLRSTAEADIHSSLLVPEDRSPVNRGWPRFLNRGNSYSLHRGNCLSKVLAGVESSGFADAPKRIRLPDLLIGNPQKARREMDPESDYRENQRRRRIAGRPATRITGARRLLILRFSRGHVTAERYLHFEAEARHPRTPTGEDAGLLFVYVYEARSASRGLETIQRASLEQLPRRSRVQPIARNCHAAMLQMAPFRRC